MVQLNRARNINVVFRNSTLQWKARHGLQHYVSLSYNSHTEKFSDPNSEISLEFHSLLLQKFVTNIEFVIRAVVSMMKYIIPELNTLPSIATHLDLS